MRDTVKQKRPYVTAVFLVSWDGRVLEEADVQSEAARPWSVAERARVRAGADAVLARGGGVVPFSVGAGGREQEGFAGLPGLGDFRAGSCGTDAHLGIMSTLVEEFGVRRLVFEAEGALFLRFLEQRCVDELCLIFCSQIRGSQGGGTITGVPGEFLPSSVKASLISVERTGAECVTRWRLRYARNPKTKVSKRVFRNS